jgi:hypothetical protein
MVRESSVTLVSGASRIPFERSSRIRRFPWRYHSSTIVEQIMAMRKKNDEVFPNAAGIDVGASSHWVAVPSPLAEESVREFGAMTDDLNGMADWLLACGVDTVALESTGVYWIPVYEVLEQRGLKVWLVDARQLKYVPGRKSDVQDCQWLQKLMSFGLLRAAWRPDGEVCVVRAVARQREVLLRPAQIHTNKPELDEDEKRGVSWRNRGNTRPLRRVGRLRSKLPGQPGAIGIEGWGLVQPAVTVNLGEVTRIGEGGQFLQEIAQCGGRLVR